MRQPSRRGVKVTGATVHLVNEIPDGGRILLQKAVEILPGDTPETLAAPGHGTGGVGAAAPGRRTAGRRTSPRKRRSMLMKQDLCALLRGNPYPGRGHRAGHDAGRQVVRGRLFHHGPQRQQPQPRLRGGAGRHPYPGGGPRQDGGPQPHHLPPGTADGPGTHRHQRRPDGHHPGVFESRAFPWSRPSARGNSSRTAPTGPRAFPGCWGPTAVTSCPS